MSRRKGPSEPDLPLFDFPLEGGADAADTPDVDPPLSGHDPSGSDRPGALPPDPEITSHGAGTKPAATEPTVTDGSKPAAPAVSVTQSSLFDRATGPRSAPILAPVPAPEPVDPAPIEETSAANAADATVANETTNVPLTTRLIAGVSDFAVHVAVVAAMVGCAVVMGVPVGWHSWPSFGLLAAAFSFLYWVVPLAFWGQTPGMAWVGVSSRALDDEPLSFSQTALRWLGALLTVALAGLPLILARSGNSLSDRLSQSKTLVE